MNKLFFTVLVSAAIVGSSSLAKADFNTPPAPKQAGAAGPTTTAGQYGWNPILKKVLWWKKDDCGKGGKACASDGAGGPPGTPGNMTGTLVFPVNPFVRSPRDYFMYGQGGN